ncbi:MAG TPA: RDD family protein [Candidatus Angelobacter sp.]|nr:RDD family protein [Candidatus Angelobacter sp.]
MPESLGYATMGERFLAFLCDASVGTALIGVFLAIFTLASSTSSLGFEGLKAIAVWIIPAAYMTVAECLFHGSIGKRLLRIQLRDDSPEPRHPSWFKILLRESVGKFLSGFICGIGFLMAANNPKKKTWHDRMAGTVVVRTGLVSGAVKGLLIPVLLCVYVVLGVALTEVPSRYKKDLADQLSTTETKIADIHARIVLPFSPDEPQSNMPSLTMPDQMSAYQQKMKALTPTLDEYSRLLAAEEDMVRRLHKLTRPYEFRELDAFEKVIPLRQEIAALVRMHVQLVLAFDPNKQKWDEVLRDRLRMIREIDKRNQQISVLCRAR